MPPRSQAPTRVCAGLPTRSPHLERARAAATRVEQNGNRAVDVINRLRSFYKKGAPPERAMVDVNDIIQGMTVLLRNEAVRFAMMIDLDLDLELEADVPNILADRVHCNRCSWCS